MKILKKLGIILMIMVMGCNSTFVFANFENHKVEEKYRDYIVIARNEKILEKVEGKYSLENKEEKYCETDATDKIITVKLTKKEADNIDDETGVSVEEDFIVKKSKYSSYNSKNSTQWYMRAINAEFKIKNKERNKKVKVAVIDSGIDYDERISIIEQRNFVEGEDEISVLYNDLTGHGTAVASLIAAQSEANTALRGVNPNVDIYSARIFGYKNQAKVSDVMKAVNWAIEKKVNIICMSFGTNKYSLALEKIMNYAYDNGVLLIAAAGNGGQNGNVEYPAAYDSVMAVGATNTQNQLSDFCSTGKEMEIVAPGEQIKVASSFGGEIITNGTSMSVPLVVGVASRLWEIDLNKSNKFIRGLLNNSANYIDKKCGNGIVDLKYALDSYDKFSERFQDFPKENINNKDGIIEENKTELKPYEDENYVNGLWTKVQHKGFVEYANSKTMRNNGYTISAEQFAALKVGAAFQDDKDTGLSGTKDNPYWHGSFKKVTDNKGKSYDCNYIMAYSYEMSIARKWKKAKKYVKVTNDYMSTTLPAVIRNNIKSDINGLNTKNKKLIMEKFESISGGKKWNDSYFPYLLAGMAVHNLTDTYAHSAYIKKDGKWKRILHETDSDNDNLCDPHDTDYCPNRYKAASKAAQDAIDNFFMGSSIKDCPSDFLDYYIPKYLKGYKLNKLMTFSKESYKEKGYTGKFESNYFYKNIKNASYGD